MKRVLLIEDDSIHREEIAEILRFKGFEVETAENGSIGLSKALKLLPDLILCDILMPEMDGTKVLSSVRANQLTCHTQFVFITSLADKKEIMSGMLMGANEYLTKPFTIKELLQTIENCVSRLEK
jgi:DNA-binding response OmpR family regulator